MESNYASNLASSLLLNTKQSQNEADMELLEQSLATVETAQPIPTSSSSKKNMKRTAGKKPGLYKEEVWTGQLIEGVTQKYLEYLEGCMDDTKSVFGTRAGPVIPSCIEPAEELPVENEDEDGETGKPASGFHHIMERPAAMVSQSSFLKKLEHQVKHELVRTGCSAPVYDMSWLYDDIIATEQTDDALATRSTREKMDESEEKMFGRLKIYRRAFSALILHFDALNPLLHEIKMNYDDLVLRREEQLQEANTVRKSIAHVNRDLDMRLNDLNFEGMKQLNDTEKQCYTLMKYVDRQDAAIHTMTDILNRLEHSLSEEHDLRRDSEDQKTLLMIEINDLRKKLGMPPRTLVEDSYVPVEEEVVEQEEQIITPDDPMILNASLESTTKTLDELEAKLAALEEEYKDVTPRCDLEDLKTLVEDTKEDSTRCVEMFDLETSQLKQYEEQIIKLDTEYSALEENFEEMKVKLTPRPSWINLAELIEGGLTKWKRMIDGKSSDDIAKKLVDELSTPKIPGPSEYLTALGTEEKVPPYLRYDGRIRVRKLAHRDVSIFIENIWETRIQELEAFVNHNASEPNPTEEEDDNFDFEEPQEVPVILGFESFFTKYFEKNYPFIVQRMDWTYNIIETCRNFKEIYTQYSRFLNILEGKIDEAVYHLLRTEIRIIIDVLVQRSIEANLPPGSIMLGVFIKTMEEIFSTRSEEQITRLIDAASKQTGVYAEWSILDYSTLFDIADEGLTGHFFDELALQLDEDREKYATEVLTILVNEIGATPTIIEKPEDPSGEKTVGIHEVYEAFRKNEPNISKEEMGAALAWIFMGVSTAPEQSPRGLKLVDYVRDRIQFLQFDYDEDDPQDDDKFSRAIEDILVETNEEHEEETSRQKKQRLKKLKTSTLRNVVVRVKGGAFIKSGFITSKAANRGTKSYPVSGSASQADNKAEEGDEGEEETVEASANV